MTAATLHREPPAEPTAEPQRVLPGRPRAAITPAVPRRRLPRGRGAPLASRPPLRRSSSVRPVGVDRPRVIPVSSPRAAARQAAAHPVVLRLTRRGRLLLLLLAAAVMATAFSAGRASAAARGGQPSRPPAGSVVVQRGDTLWSVARGVAPTRDPRVTVERLRRLNHLPTVQIRPGQRLLIPR